MKNQKKASDILNKLTFDAKTRSFRFAKITVSHNVTTGKKNTTPQRTSTIQHNTCWEHPETTFLLRLDICLNFLPPKKGVKHVQNHSSKNITTEKLNTSSRLSSIDYSHSHDHHHHHHHLNLSHPKNSHPASWHSHVIELLMVSPL